MRDHWPYWDEVLGAIREWCWYMLAALFAGVFVGIGVVWVWVAYLWG